MKSSGTLEELVQKLVDAQSEYDRLTLDEEEPHELGPPALPGQIAKLESILGKPLPPSYRAFLELHNGWSDFSGGAKLLAIEDHERPWVKRRIRKLGDLLFGDDSKNPFVQGAIPILLGEEENSYLVLDPRSVRKSGEMKFVRYDYGQVERTFKDFTSFLRDELDLMLSLIEDERRGTVDDEDEDEDEVEDDEGEE